jgi:hypothetical protein
VAPAGVRVTPYGFGLIVQRLAGSLTLLVGRDAKVREEFPPHGTLHCNTSTNLRRERQLEGIAKGKAAGGYQGRPASIDTAKVLAMKAEDMGATEIAKALKIGRASVYRVLEGV